MVYFGFSYEVLQEEMLASYTVNGTIVSQVRVNRIASRSRSWHVVLPVLNIV